MCAYQSVLPLHPISYGSPCIRDGTAYVSAGAQLACNGAKLAKVVAPIADGADWSTALCGIAVLSYQHSSSMDTVRKASALGKSATRSGWDLAKASTSGAVGGFKDALLEIKDSVVTRQEAPPELIAAETPADRWWTPDAGWPTSTAELPAEMVPEGYKVNKWKPPPALGPTATEAPHLFDGEEFAQAGRTVLGTVSVEVLQAEGLPKMMVGIADPYAILVFEGAAARTNTVRNDLSPCWGPDKPRAFRFPVTCPYSAVNVAVNDEDEGLLPDDPLGRVILDLSQINGRTVYDAWYDLQYGFHERAKGKRGAIRLRFSVEWEERARLLAYPQPPPTFVVPFRSRKALRDATFAVKGRLANPATFDWTVFTAQVSTPHRRVHPCTHGSALGPVHNGGDIALHAAVP